MDEREKEKIDLNENRWSGKRGFSLPPVSPGIPVPPVRPTKDNGGSGEKE